MLIVKKERKMSEDKNKNYRIADKKNGEYNDYIKGEDGIVHTVITRDRKGNEICRWESPDTGKDKNE